MGKQNQKNRDGARHIQAEDVPVLSRWLNHRDTLIGFPRLGNHAFAWILPPNWPAKQNLRQDFLNLSYG